MILKAAHTFNLLDARGAISVTERAAYIGRIRTLSRQVAQAYVDSREALGFPMLPRPNAPRCSVRMTGAMPMSATCRARRSSSSSSPRSCRRRR